MWYICQIVENISVVNTIINNKNYKLFAKKLCNGRDIHNDLYQEFVLSILEKDLDFLIQLKNTNTLDQFCYGIIKNKNQDRFKKIAINGKDMPLKELCNSMDEANYSEIESEDYIYKVDENFNKVIDYISSDKSVKQEEVFILFESLNTNLRKIAKKCNLKYFEITKTRSKLINNIKHNVKL